jgi:hypothetical protein
MATNAGPVEAVAADVTPEATTTAAAPPDLRAPAAQLLALQRTIGNRAVGRLLARTPIDDQPEPDVLSQPANHYVDAFTEAYYDLDYRSEGGNLSTWLTLEYSDGTLIDVNIFDLLDEATEPTAVTDLMRQGHVGIGNRIFPARMNRATVPRLWAARLGAIDVMEQYNFEFILAALPAVLFILSLAGAPPLVRPVPTAGAGRLRARTRSGSTGGGSRAGAPGGAGASATATATRQAVGFTRAARNAPELGGFRNGISTDEIVALNRQFGGSTTITGHPSSALAAAARQTGFWNKAAAIVREVAGRHMFDDANKRTASAIVNELTRRNQVFTGVTGAELRAVIHQVATGTLRTVEEIAVALRGF